MSLINNLLQAVDGPIPSVDAFIELLLVVDVSPAAAAAAEAAAAPQPRLPPAPRLAPPPGAAPFGDAGACLPLAVYGLGLNLTCMMHVIASVSLYKRVPTSVLCVAYCRLC